MVAMFCRIIMGAQMQYCMYCQQILQFQFPVLVYSYLYENELGSVPVSVSVFVLAVVGSERVSSSIAEGEAALEAFKSMRDVSSVDDSNSKLIRNVCVRVCRIFRDLNLE